jgi:hypothetical protein
MVNKRDVTVFIVCLSYHFDVGLFHIIGHGGTPLAVLDDTYILTMTRALLGTLSKVARGLGTRIHGTRGFQLMICQAYAA